MEIAFERHYKFERKKLSYTKENSQNDDNVTMFKFEGIGFAVKGCEDDSNIRDNYALEAKLFLDGNLVTT